MEVFKRNEEVIKYYKFGYSTPKLADFFDVSVERITQIISCDNSDLRNKRLGRLSLREKEILEYIAQGFTDGEIAYKLGISARTIQTHVARIVIKTGALNRTNAVYISVKENIIE